MVPYISKNGQKAGTPKPHNPQKRKKKNKMAFSPAMVDNFKEAFACFDIEAKSMFF